LIFTQLAKPTALIVILILVLTGSASGLKAEAPTREVFVTVVPDSAGADGRVEAVIEIAASTAQVWAVMLDCARAPNFMPALKSCTVLQADPNGDWDIREHRVSWIALLPDTRSVFRSQYVEYKSISFSRVDGDFQILEGSWQLQPIDDGARTRLSYRARIGIALPIPAFLLRSALESDVPKFLKALRTEIEGG
jgi:uncharacterized membrane protein